MGKNKLDKDAIYHGTVKWFNDAKGYGFICSDEVDALQGIRADILAHHSHIVCEGFPTLAEGQHVKFHVEEYPKGLMAKNIIKVKADL